jgi:hypothetical protein
MPNVVSLTIKDGVQKGPATDYSMLLEMKRRNANAQNGQIWKTPAGNQAQKPFLREGHLQAGSGTDGTQAVEYYKIRGIKLNLYKF